MPAKSCTKIRLKFDEPKMMHVREDDKERSFKVVFLLEVSKLFFLLLKFQVTRKLVNSFFGYKKIADSLWFFVNFSCDGRMMIILVYHAKSDHYLRKNY